MKTCMKFLQDKAKIFTGLYMISQKFKDSNITWSYLENKKEKKKLTS